MAWALLLHARHHLQEHDPDHRLAQQYIAQRHLRRGGKFGAYYTEGEWTYRQYDVLNTNYMLLWGADPIAANRQVSFYSSAWGNVLDRATVVAIDPRLSSSASKADE